MKKYAFAIAWILKLSFFLFYPWDMAVASGLSHGAKSTAMGAAFVAIADDLSAIVCNPAGIVHLKGTQIYLGTIAIIPTTKYKSPAGKYEETEFQIFCPPHLYFSHNFPGENMAFGVGIFSPYGIGGRKWSKQGQTRYLATENLIMTLSVNPTFSWKVNNNLSVGCGVYYMGAYNKTKNMIDQSSLGHSDAEFTFKGDGGGMGYNLGALIFPNSQFSIGLSYRSRVKVKQKGTASVENIAPPLQSLFGGPQFKTHTSIDMDFPDIGNIGIAYKPTSRFIIGLEGEWTGWSRFDTQVLDFETEIPQADFSDMTMNLDWKDTWILKIGLEYKLNALISLRMGYVYVENPVPSYSLTPANPDADQHNLCLGFGYTRKRRTVIDFFYTADFFKKRKVQNTYLSGEYRNFAHITGVSVGYKF